MMFGSPEVVFWDSLRIIAGLASLMIALTTPFIVITREMRWDQRVRFIGSALVGAGIVGAYLQALGTVPEQWWRTPMITVGMLMLAIGQFVFINSTSTRRPSRHRR